MRTPLIALQPVLLNWIQLLEDYADASQGDAAYWWNERASVSTLAGAAWRTAGWIALEEYRTYKATSKTTNKTGRCDLWLAQKGLIEEAIEIEAKQGWQSFAADINLLSKVNDKLWYDAIADATALDDASHRTAALFLVPDFKETPTKSMQNHAIDRVINFAIRSDIAADVVIWGFPNSNKEAVSSRVTVSDKHYPGAFLILKVI